MPSIDFSKWAAQDDATQKKWLDDLQPLIVKFRKEHPNELVITHKDIPDLTQSILIGLSARKPIHTEYFVITEAVGNGTSGKTFAVPIVIKEKPNGSLEVSDRSAKNKAYEYLIKLFQDPEEIRESKNWNFDEFKNRCENEIRIANLYLRTRGKDPYRPVIVDPANKIVYGIEPRVPGEALTKLVRKTIWGEQSFAMIFCLLYQLTLQLVRLKKNHHVHGDLKADNINVSLTKGLLHWVDPGSLVLENTAAIKVRGSAGYYAPEYLVPGAPATSAIDVYAALAIFLLMLGAVDCITKKQAADQELAQISENSSPAEVIKLFGNLAYNEKGLFEKRKVNKVLRDLFREILDKMGDFSASKRADPEWIAGKMKEIYYAAIQASYAQLKAILAQFPGLDRTPQGVVVIDLDRLKYLIEQDCDLEHVQTISNHHG